MGNFPWLRVAVALVVSLYMAYSGRKKRSLTGSGAAAACLVGFVSLSCGWRFGATLITFYKTSSWLTKQGGRAKAVLEDGHKEGGQRDASQVLACSGFAVCVCSLFAAWHGPEDCLLDYTALPWQTMFHCAYLAFFSCCAGDTWASEIGLVYGAGVGPDALGALPRLAIPPFKRVPRGTNGGMSPVGTAASALGGLAMAATYYLVGEATTTPSVRAGGGGNAPPQLLPMLLVGLLGGFGGSLLDSVMGALLQANWLDTERNVILEHAPAPSKQRDRRFQWISGYDLMSNEQVNAISSVLTSLACGCCAPFLF